MHVLVIRLSAMGDVAMTVPVLVEAMAQNPSLRITVLSRKPFDKFFPISDRLTFVHMDTKGQHKGLVGIRKMFKQLKKSNDFDAVADFHNVLRSNVLSQFFKISGVAIAKIDKGRSQKKALTSKENKEFKPLKHSTERYVEVLHKLGIQVSFNSKLLKQYLQIDKSPPIVLNKVNVGFAPFAQHSGKAYAFDKMKEVINSLSKNKDVNVLLFGGGKKEVEMIESIEGENVISLAGKYTLEEELAQMKSLDVMVSMDSSNMHMASLVGTRVISIWGATHYFAGFLGVGQSIDDIVEVSANELPCRPCSVFGNKPCYRKDYACLEVIKPQEIVAKINAALNH